MTEPTNAGGSPLSREPRPPLEASDSQFTALEALHVFEYLEQDDRASFVIDLDAPPQQFPVYWNPVFRKNKSLRHRILGLRELYVLREDLRHSPDWTFLQWQVSRQANGHAASCRDGQFYWVATTLRQRWRVISAVLTVQNLSAANETAVSRSHAASSHATSRTASPPALEEVHAQRTSPAQPEPESHKKTPLDSKQHYEPNVESAKVPLETPIPSHAHTIDVDATGPGRGQSAYLHGERLEHDEIADHFLTDFKADGQDTSIGSFDWTRPDPSVVISPFVKFFRNFDWTSTDLGPIENWSPILRRLVLMLMTDPRPAAMYIGPQRVMIYNQVYRFVAGSRHPDLMGKPFEEAWPELGDAFESTFRRAAESGLASQRDDGCFFINRGNYLEETYFRLSMIPVALEEGFAMYNPIFETTRQVITDRRMRLLLSVAAEVAGSKDRAEFWSSLEQALNSNSHEVPFALMFSAQRLLDENLSTPENEVTRETWTLEGSIGYEEDNLASIPTEFGSNHDAAQSFLPLFDRYIRDQDPTVLRRADGSLPDALAVPSRLFGDSSNTAVLMPIRSSGDNVHGFMILGINPRRPYDDDYQVFIQLLASQLATAMASTVLLEDEARESRLAHSDRAKQAEKALEAEARFRNMADLAPVGMFHFDAAGMPIYCNDMWYAITEYPRGSEYPMCWYNVIHPDDHAYMDEQWARLNAGAAVSFELRLRRPFKAAEIVGGEKLEGFTWILAAAYSRFQEDGTVSAIQGCLTDISRQKWAEDFQTRRKKEALELKRQQESFIDMTSHEMRNPLSAILMCADTVAASLGELDVADGNTHATLSKELVASNLDAVQTIALCAQHQTRIIDDVLTLSKIDASLLHISPVEVQPSVVVDNSLRIFDGELKKNAVHLTYNVEQSYKDLAVNWVKLDPSRVLQILINLLSNAIKFTSTQQKRAITVSIGASRERPTSAHGVEYLPCRQDRQETIETKDWGTGELLYLQVQVQDTGKGLHEHERSLLFQRFSQTSPRTHVQYGGSGLGLFISRELTELQGGEIGVFSQAGVGSIFAFFVKARRTDPPAPAVTAAAPGQAPAPSQKPPQFDIGKHKALNPGAFGRLPERTLSPATAARIGKPPLAISDKARHVLVVEDNLVNQKVLSKQLKGVGCVVSVANHGGEALAFLKTSWFCVDGGAALDVVLMDLEMPVMDGLTCAKTIREMQKSDKIRGWVPIIAVTANARSEQIMTAKDSGMDGVVTKPFRIADLVPEMERIAALHTTPRIEKGV